MSNRILVIGNGFDLACGLNSRFSDFITTEKMKNWIDHPGLCPNFWYLLFAIKYGTSGILQNGGRMFKVEKHGEQQWMNIESFIKEISIGQHPRKYRGLTESGTYLQLFEKIYEERHNPSFLYADFDFQLIRKYFKNYSNNNLQDTHPFNIINFLKSELQNFETEFCSFLKLNIDNDKEYFKKVSDLLSKLGYPFPNYYLIDFNYTHDLDELITTVPEETNFIHGSIKKGAIIGFDSSDIENFPIYLSKAWQKMSASIENPKLPEFEHSLTIEFFGHSLGEQDYAYFHALFDRYDIYNKNVNLIFTYSMYKKTDEENRKLITEYCDKVYKLLNDYAQRSGKEIKYKTIISRLQIENRLHICDLDNRKSISEFFEDITVHD